MERFLLTICKEHTLTRSTTLFSRIHPILCFWMSAEAQYCTVTSSNRQIQQMDLFCKKAILKNFTIFRGKHLGWSLFLIKSPTLRLATLSRRDTNTGVFLLGNFYFKKCFWTDFRKGLLGTLLLASRFQIHSGSLILEKYRFHTRALNTMQHLCCLYI